MAYYANEVMMSFFPEPITCFRLENLATWKTYRIPDNNIYIGIIELKPRLHDNGSVLSQKSFTFPWKRAAALNLFDL